MKNSFVFFLLILAFINVNGQNKGNIGIFTGASSYMGDINPELIIYSPSISGGVFYRYDINSRYAIKAGGNYTKLKGSDLDFPGRINPDRPGQPRFFNNTILDVSLLAEFNFFPFNLPVRTISITPFLATGIAGGLVLSSDVATENFLSLPIGIGVKAALTQRLSAGAEWSFRRTFSDNIDGYSNPTGITSNYYNNDWYSYLGVFISYKFFNFAVDCPAYGQK